MVAAVPSTAGLLPHPIEVCKRINRLNHELKLARRLLRVAMDACEKVPVGTGPEAPKSSVKAEAANVG